MKYLTIILISTTLLGCVSNDTLSGDVYSFSDAKQIQNISYGTLTNVRQVQIQGNDDDSNVIGVLGGAVLGGLLGNTIGEGTGQNLATAAGVVAGSVAGANIESTVNRIQGIELEIQKDNGEIIVIIQKQGNTKFKTGQRVAIIKKNNKVTVSPRN